MQTGMLVPRRKHRFTFAVVHARFSSYLLELASALALASRFLTYFTRGR
jgi:hypothetical protein